MMPTCCIIGETKLAIRCGEILQRSNYKVIAFVSTYDLAKDWATHYNIPHYTSIEQFFVEWEEIQFDYLFSIVNPNIMNTKILSKAKHLAINFHDALLPRYAGVNATSWSILHGEQQQGISWHLMSNEIDRGDILKQAHFKIDTHETASSLINKGYDAAIAAFTELLDDLSKNNHKPQPQNLLNRTYHSFKDLFPNHAIISYDMGAKMIVRLWRSLQKGEFINKLTLPKIFMHDEFFILKRCSIASRTSNLPPGTINKITDEYISIATGTTDIIIHELSTLDGCPMNLIDLMKSKRCDVGKCLPQFDFESKVMLKKTIIASKLKEGFWMRKLTKYRQSSLSFHGTLSKKHNAPPTFVLKKLDLLLAHTVKNDEAALLALLIDCFYTMNDNSPLIIWFENDNLVQRSEQTMGLVARRLPLLIDFKREQIFSETLRFAKKTLLEINTIPAYEKDLFLRYHLESLVNEHKQIFINFNHNRIPAETIYADYDLALHVCFQTREVSIRINKMSFSINTDSIINTINARLQKLSKSDLEQ